jgi:DNA-binding response OmpR family regulator
MAARSPLALRILVVEDNQDAAQGLALLLRKQGHSVEAVNWGHSAVETAALFRPDVALIDIGLPDISGYEVAKEIRQQLGDTVVLIAMTAWDWAADRKRAREAGFDEHLRKPVNFTTLAQRLSDLDAKIPRKDPVSA